MNPILPRLPPHHPFLHPPSCNGNGTKRRAPDLDPDDELERSSHISTQFKKLRLNNQHHNFTGEHPNKHQSHGLAGEEVERHRSGASLDADGQYQHRSPESNHRNKASTSPVSSHMPIQSNDLMTIDETPHKIHIPNLDAEIASIEASETSVPSLIHPDFERHISGIPSQVLRDSRDQGIGPHPHPYLYGHDNGAGPSRANCQALVLYRAPSSISVPVEEDAVRKAILEARRGVREKLRREQRGEREMAGVHPFANEGGNGMEWLRRQGGLVEYQPEYHHPSRGMVRDAHLVEDGDAMEIE